MRPESSLISQIRTVDVVGKAIRQSGVSALGQTIMLEESDCIVDCYQLRWLCVVLVQRAFQFAGLAFSCISKAVLAECATTGVARVPTGFVDVFAAVFATFPAVGAFQGALAVFAACGVIVAAVCVALVAGVQAIFAERVAADVASFRVFVADDVVALVAQVAVVAVAVGCWIVEGAVGAFAVAHFSPCWVWGVNPCLCERFQYTI